MQARTAARSTLTVLAVVLLGLSAIDLAITELAIRRLGAVELNPLMEPLIGTPWAVVVKLGIPALVVVTVHRARSRLVAVALAGTVAFYGTVSVVNVTQVLVEVA